MNKMRRLYTSHEKSVILHEQYSFSNDGLCEISPNQDVTFSQVIPAGHPEMREILEDRGLTISEEQNFNVGQRGAN
jgi:hypothetical protein